MNLLRLKYASLQRSGYFESFPYMHAIRMSAKTHEKPVAAGRGALAVLRTAKTMRPSTTRMVSAKRTTWYDSHTMCSEMSGFWRKSSSQAFTRMWM